MGRFAHRALICLAFAAFNAYGYEIQVGDGTAVGESEFYIVPSGRGCLTLKFASIPVAAIEAAPGGGGRSWRTMDGAATAAANGNGAITVRHRDFLKGGPAELVFENGRLRTIRRDGDEGQRAKDIKMLSAHPSKQPTLRQLWRPRTAAQEEAGKARWWRDDSRLRLGYFNPNAAGTLFAEIAALFAALALVLRRCGLRLTCLGVAAAALVALFLTGSRGSFVALAIGAGFAVCVRLKNRLLRAKTLASVFAVVALAGLVMFVAGRATGGRFGENLLSVDEGNVQRLRCWAAAPEMMAAAPGGWGDEPGRAYCDWFQGLKDNHRLYYLVNSHLTWMVQHGRLFRCAYVSAWLILLVFLFASARQKASQVAIAVWGTFAVALWFSTVGIFPTLWIIPVGCGAAALAVAAFAASQNNCRTCWQRALACAIGCILVGSAVPFTLEAIGRRQSLTRAVPVRFDGHAIRLGHGDARVAVVRDETVLAGDFIGSLGHELRDWMEADGHAGAVLVLDNPADLPERVDRLVLAGKGAARYLKYRAAHLEDGKYCKAEKTVMLSPPFSPEAVPFILTQSSDVRIVVGEFAARLAQGYSRERPWVTVVRGAELYIPGWPDMAIADSRGARP